MIKRETIRAVLFRVLAVGLSLTVALVIGEIVLRSGIVPGIRFERYVDDEMITRLFKPRSTVFYTSDRGDFVKRRVNRWGYLDVEHERAKPPGVYRIGFFGDSYTEARQVPIDSTFFRIVERDLTGSRVETMAFGRMNLGTVHEYLLSTRETELFDLDLVVYVFWSNDVRDNIKELQGSVPDGPYAELGADGALRIDRSFVQGRRPSWFADTYQTLVGSSVLLSTVRLRLKLLLLYGPKMRMTDADREMNTYQKQPIKLSNGIVIPPKYIVPSNWSELSLNYVTALCEAILLQWRDDVEAGGNRRFAVLYIPREGEWRDARVSWRGWLNEFTAEHGIPFIDGTDAFGEVERAGHELFYDHLTPAGHVALAEAFHRWDSR